MSDPIIMNVLHYDWYRRPPKKPYEEEEQTILTEQAHIPLRTMIKRFKQAGILLDAFNKNVVYDFQNDAEVDLSLDDPTRSLDFDMADATMLQDAAIANIEEQLETTPEPTPETAVETPPEEPEDSSPAVT